MSTQTQTWRYASDSGESFEMFDNDLYPDDLLACGQIEFKPDSSTLLEGWAEVYIPDC